MTTTQVSSKLHGHYKAKAYAAANANSPLASITIPRRDPGEHDVQIEILFCVSATLISTPFVTSGVQYQLSIHVYPDMRSSAVSPRSALQSPSSSPAILLR